MRELSLVRLSLASPLLTALENRGQPVADVLAAFGFTAQVIHQSEIFVTAPVMYALVEAISEASGDPYFGVHVGEDMDLAAWPPLHDAVTTSATLGDALVKFILQANEYASTVSYSLKTERRRTTFAGKRRARTDIVPAHNDSFEIAYLLKVIEAAVQDRWNGGDVLIRICRPEVVPPRYRGVNVAATDSLGASISFPSQWLLLKPALYRQRNAGELSSSETPSLNSIEALHQALQPFLGDDQLSAERVAGFLGLSRRSLARKLRLQGTSLGKELRQLRMEKARALLIQHELAIAEIARQVGYKDPAVFARAFRRCTGRSPSEFRRERLIESTVLCQASKTYFPG